MITYNQLTKLARTLTERDKKYTYLVNRRNGYYAVDYYTKSPKYEYRGYLETGEAKEIYYFLKGMLEVFWLMY